MGSSGDVLRGSRKGMQGSGLGSCLEHDGCVQNRSLLIQASVSASPFCSLLAQGKSGSPEMNGDVFVLLGTSGLGGCVASIHRSSSALSWLSSSGSSSS